MTRPILLDLFCGAGGVAVGYHRAGFHVIGVDISPQPNYPFEFHQADALEVLALMTTWRSLEDTRAIHASPPCQIHSTQTADKSRHVDLIPATRAALIATGLPYVIENVEGAAKTMDDPVRLCGSSFGLDVRRHRYFETNWGMVGVDCNHAAQTPRFRSLNIAQHRAGKLASVVGVHGHLNYPGEFEIRCNAMGIHWMTVAELSQAIPPAFTHHIGLQMIEQLK